MHWVSQNWEPGDTRLTFLLWSFFSAVAIMSLSQSCWNPPPLLPSGGLRDGWCSVFSFHLCSKNAEDSKTALVSPASVAVIGRICLPTHFRNELTLPRWTFFFFKDFSFPFFPQSAPVRSCVFFLVVGPSTCGMWDAASAWLDEQCHVHAQGSNQPNPEPPKQSMQT